MYIVHKVHFMISWYGQAAFFNRNQEILAVIKIKHLANFINRIIVRLMYFVQENLFLHVFSHISQFEGVKLCNLYENYSGKSREFSFIQEVEYFYLFRNKYRIFRFYSKNCIVGNNIFRHEKDKYEGWSISNDSDCI